MKTILVSTVSSRQAVKRTAFVPLPGQERGVELSPDTKCSCYFASRGCFGPSDEPWRKEKEQYGLPKDLDVIDAKKMFEWWLGGEAVGGRVIRLRTDREFISLVMGKALQSQR